MHVETVGLKSNLRLQNGTREQSDLRVSTGVSKSTTLARPRNHIIAALPQDTWSRIVPHIGHALLIQGRPIHENYKPVEQVYFPNGGLVSLVVDSSGGARVEAGVIGREGAVGIFEALNETPPTQRGVVQIAGTACWLPASVFRTEFRRGGEFQELILRYLQAMNAQATQCVLCNRLHSVEERLARWLLMTHDRLASEEIPVTHEAIAQLLGTRRSSITVALGEFEAQGLVRCARGRLEILDTECLGEAACECYGALRGQAAPRSKTTLTA